MRFLGTITGFKKRKNELNGFLKKIQTTQELTANAKSLPAFESQNFDVLVLFLAFLFVFFFFFVLVKDTH